MNTQIAAVIAQANAAMYYHHAMSKGEAGTLVRDRLNGPTRQYTEAEARTHKTRMQSLAARHSAAARRAMGVES